VIRRTTPGALALTAAVNVTGDVSRAVFEHESPNKRILTGCERAVLVIFGTKTDWTGVEFDPGYPSTLTTE